MCFTFGLSLRGSEAVVTLAVSHMTPRVVSSASQLQWPCGVMGAVNGMWCVCGGLRSGARTGAAGASAGVFSSPPRRARLNLARNPLSAGGVWGLRVWVCGRTLENRPWSPPLLPAVHSTHKAVIRGGVVGGGSAPPRASPAGFGFRVVASAASRRPWPARGPARWPARWPAPWRSPTKRPTNFIKATKTPHSHPPKTAHSALRAAAARA